MFRGRWLFSLLLVLVVLSPLSSCSNGGECDRCNTDQDCKTGLFCVQFRDTQGNLLADKRCGSGQGAVQCRVLKP